MNWLMHKLVPENQNGSNNPFTIVPYVQRKYIHAPINSTELNSHALKPLRRYHNYPLYVIWVNMMAHYLAYWNIFWDENMQFNRQHRKSVSEYQATTYFYAHTLAHTLGDSIVMCAGTVFVTIKNVAIIPFKAAFNLRVGLVRWTAYLLRFTSNPSLSWWRSRRWSTSTAMERIVTRPYLEQLLVLSI